MTNKIAEIHISVPTFNRIDVLKDFIASLQRQSFENFTCVVVDNGPSTDGTEEFMREVCQKDSRFEHMTTPPSGAFIARNQGLRNRPSEILMTFDDDVELMAPNTLEYVYELFQTREDLGVLGLSEYYPGGKGQGESLSPSEDRTFWSILRDSTLYSPGKINRWGMIGNKLYFLPYGEIHEVDHVRSSSMAFRRDVYEKVGGFFEPYIAMGLGYRTETDFCLSAKALGVKVCFSQKEPQVYHKAAQRPRGWVRSATLNSERQFFTCRNNTYMFLTHYWGYLGWPVFMWWDIWIGNTTEPGLLRLMHKRVYDFKVYRSCLFGKLTGMMMFFKYPRHRRIDL